jgi:hypothetical protein
VFGRNRRFTAVFTRTVIGSYLESDKPKVHPSSSFRFNIILSPNPDLSSGLFPSGLRTKICVRIPHFLIWTPSISYSLICSFISGIISSVRHADCTSALFVQCGRNLNYILIVGTLVARKANETMVAPIVGSGGVCSQTVGSMLVRLAGTWLQSPWRFFRICTYIYSHIFFIKTFYKFYTFNAISEDNAAIIVLLLSTEKVNSRQLWRVTLS